MPLSEEGKEHLIELFDTFPKKNGEESILKLLLDPTNSRWDSTWRKKKMYEVPYLFSINQIEYLLEIILHMIVEDGTRSTCDHLTYLWVVFCPHRCGKYYPERTGKPSTGWQKGNPYYSEHLIWEFEERDIPLIMSRIRSDDPSWQDGLLFQGNVSFEAWWRKKTHEETQSILTTLTGVADVSELILSFLTCKREEKSEEKSEEDYEETIRRLAQLHQKQIEKDLEEYKRLSKVFWYLKGIA